jgi:hypothetical protein
MSEKSITEKLQIKPKTRLLFINPPEDYLQSMGALPVEVTILPADSGESADFIQVFVKNGGELVEAFTALKGRIAKNGALWVCYYKGTSKYKTDINRDSIWPVATTYGLQPVRQIAIDEDWSALRFKVIES